MAPRKKLIPPHLRGKKPSNPIAAVREQEKSPVAARFPAAPPAPPNPNTGLERGHGRWQNQPGRYGAWSPNINSATAGPDFGSPQNLQTQATSPHPLADWSGNWAPAPVDWENRAEFVDLNGMATIDRWVGGCVDALDEQRIRAVQNKLPPVEHEIAPAYWKPDDTEIFNEILTSPPKPLLAADLDEWPPFWSRYIGEHHLAMLSQPAIAGNDPDESFDERLAREHDKGNLTWQENLQILENTKRQNRRSNAFAVDGIRPGADIYIRSAGRDDGPEISGIVNYYINCSPTAIELNEIPENDIMGRILTARVSNLPFLVACKRGQLIKSRKKKFKREDIVLPDEIVGVIWLEFFNPGANLYRATAQLNLFTHYQWYGKGIAKCLLDKALDLVDPDYVSRRAYDIQGGDMEGMQPTAVIKNVLVSFHYSNDNQLVWMERFLTGSTWSFEKVGHVKDIGVKFDKSVHHVMFSRRSGKQITSDERPAPPGFL